MQITENQQKMYDIKKAEELLNKHSLLDTKQKEKNDSELKKVKGK